MIFDHLENADKYTCLNPHFVTAFAMLGRSNITSLPEGRIEIDGDLIFATIIKGKGRSPEEGKLETHDRYIDVQFLIEGTESVGWKSRNTLGQPAGPHDPDRDVTFYDDEPDLWLTLKPGMFAISFPEDGHMPMVTDRELHKVVIKVAV